MTRCLSQNRYGYFDGSLVVDLAAAVVVVAVVVAAAAIAAPNASAARYLKSR